MLTLNDFEINSFLFMSIRGHIVIIFIDRISLVSILIFIDRMSLVSIFILSMHF